MAAHTAKSKLIKWKVTLRIFFGKIVKIGMSVLLLIRERYLPYLQNLHVDFASTTWWSLSLQVGLGDLVESAK